MDFEYLKDPSTIEAESFRRVRALTDLTDFEERAQQVVMRLVHCCGMPEIVSDLHVSDHAIDAGLCALRSRAPVLCDVEMLRRGLTRRFIDSPCLCYLDAVGVDDDARARGETRTMAALDRWNTHLDGAIAAVGNAPTALFRLLEMLEAGADRPALVIGMPVGFVGAAESKDALLDFSRRESVPSIVLRGRKGGSAMAASVINALARLARGITV